MPMQKFLPRRIVKLLDKWHKNLLMQNFNDILVNICSKVRFEIVKNVGKKEAFMMRKMSKMTNVKPQKNGEFPTSFIQLLPRTSVKYRVDRNALFRRFTTSYKPFKLFYNTNFLNLSKGHFGTFKRNYSG